MFLQTICTVCDGPFAAKDKKLKRNNDKKEVHKKGIICRVAIPYELKDDILGGIKMKIGRSLMQSHCGQRLKVKVGS